MIPRHTFDKLTAEHDTGRRVRYYILPRLVVNPDLGLGANEIIEFIMVKGHKQPLQLRRIIYRDPETSKVYNLLSKKSG